MTTDEKKSWDVWLILNPETNYRPDLPRTAQWVFSAIDTEAGMDVKVMTNKYGTTFHIERVPGEDPHDTFKFYQDMGLVSNDIQLLRPARAIAPSVLEPGSPKMTLAASQINAVISLKTIIWSFEGHMTDEQMFQRTTSLNTEIEWFAMRYPSFGISIDQYILTIELGRGKVTTRGNLKILLDTVEHHVYQRPVTLYSLADHRARATTQRYAVVPQPAQS